MGKSNKNTEVAEKSSAKKASNKRDNGFLFGILGIGISLVVVSIVYCIAVILLGTKGLVPKIMVAPAGAFVLIVVGIAFSKLFK